MEHFKWTPDYLHKKRSYRIIIKNPEYSVQFRCSCVCVCVVSVCWGRPGFSSAPPPLCSPAERPPRPADRGLLLWRKHICTSLPSQKPLNIKIILKSISLIILKEDFLRSIMTYTVYDLYTVGPSEEGLNGPMVCFRTFASHCIVLACLLTKHVNKNITEIFGLYS